MVGGRRREAFPDMMMAALKLVPTSYYRKLMSPIYESQQLKDIRNIFVLLE